jgi:hypothetical protein
VVSGDKADIVCLSWVPNFWACDFLFFCCFARLGYFMPSSFCLSQKKKKKNYQSSKNKHVKLFFIFLVFNSKKQTEPII